MTDKPRRRGTVTVLWLACILGVAHWQRYFVFVSVRGFRPLQQSRAPASTRIALQQATTDVADKVTTLSPEVQWDLPPVEERPGHKDHESFLEGPSVKSWQESNIYDAADFQGVSFAGSDGPYWLYHVGRTGFFAAQGLASVAAANVASLVRSRSEGSAGESVTPKFLEKFINSPDTLKNIVSQALRTFKQDLGYIKKGYFKAPYDMSPRHRQWFAPFVAEKSLRYINEAVSTLQRSAEKADTSTWVDSSNDLYPRYYRHTFHYQRDGWFSSDSAKVYETSTETLFLGRQDAMQRTSLVHIAKHLTATGRAGTTDGLKLLEVGCGTGRVNTFIRDNWPRMDVTVSDLSPFYLEEARKNGAYWERNFAPATVGKASFVQANAEALPFAPSSFDIVVSVYLFHEIPAEAQDNVFAEAARVLAPGGLFVLTDSIQLGDRPQMDDQVGEFGNFAEPHYQAYIRRDLAELARSHGLEPREKELSSSTKSVSFVKTGGVAQRIRQELSSSTKSVSEEDAESEEDEGEQSAEEPPEEPPSAPSKIRIR